MHLTPRVVHNFPKAMDVYRDAKLSSVFSDFYKNQNY